MFGASTIVCSSGIRWVPAGFPPIFAKSATIGQRDETLKRFRLRKVAHTASSESPPDSVREASGLNGLYR